MEKTIYVFMSILLFAVTVIARPSCKGLSLGYYCTSNTTSHYYWCYGQEYPVENTCTANLVCPCGFTANNPCVWPGTKLPDCKGAPGTILKEDGGKTDSGTSTSDSGGGDDGGDDDDSSVIDDVHGIYAIPPSKHVPLVLYFNTSHWKKQLQMVISSSFYDDSSQYSATTDEYMCSFHPPPKYDKNPTQLWIGRPSNTMTISYTPDITMRLPDKYIGLFLGYAMDQYGLNPSMILSLAAKESFLPVIWASQDKSYFIVGDGDTHYDCYSPTKSGLCTDGNLDGPFQVETGGMSSDVSSFPHRFYTGDMSVPKSDRKPSYLTDNEFLQQSGFRAFHDSYTLDMGKAVILTALDFHFRHTLLWTMKKSGLSAAMTKRDRNGQDALEFATMMYTYNRGVFDTQLTTMLGKCTAAMNPTECGLDGYGGHTTDIRTACKLLDSSPNNQVYDWTVTSSDLSYFLDTLEETYPYSSIPYVQDYIDWTDIRKEASEAFNILKAHREKVSGTKYKNGISFRYDWRTLLAVIRMRLPPRETMLGPSVENFANYWGTTRTTSQSPTIDPEHFPLQECSLVGSHDNICSGSSSPDPEPTSSSGSTLDPSTTDECPNDPEKTTPGKCGCGVPETTWCCTKEAYDNCDGELLGKKYSSSNSECAALMSWACCLIQNGCSKAQKLMNTLQSCSLCT